MGTLILIEFLAIHYYEERCSMYKLLIIDDNYMQIQSLLTFLDWPKFGVTEIKLAQDGRKGLDIFRDFSPDIVITDIVMPEMDGIELTKQIRRIKTDTKFIYISCYEKFDYMKEAMENEVVSYLLKPIDPKALEDSVKQTIDKIEYERDFVSMSALLKKSIDIYRKNFLYQLLYSKYIDSEYLKNTIKSLQLDKCNLFAIAKIEIIKPKRPIDIYNLLNLTESYLFTDKTGTAVAENMNGIVVLFASDISNKDRFSRNIKSLMESYDHMVNQEYNINVNIGISSIYDNLLNFHLLLEEADFAKENNLTFAGNGVYMYEETERLSPQYNILELKNTLNELANKSTEENAENIEIFVDNAFPNGDYSNQYDVRMLIVCVFTILQIILAERNMMNKEISDKINNLWANIYTPQEAQTVKARFKNALTDALNLITHDYEAGDIVKGVNDQIINNYRDIKNIGQIASCLYVSEGYARKIYKKQTGKTIFDALYEKRMETVQRLLSETNMTVIEVANAVGYKSKQYFIEAFKRYTGYLPKDFSNKT
jgi:two-component system response regulator YesN